MWLRDFLPEFVPTARILIYGYDSQLKESSSFASIFEFAKQFLDAVKTIRGPMVSLSRWESVAIHAILLEIDIPTTTHLYRPQPWWFSD
jgi:hypothetical protein